MRLGARRAAPPILFGKLPQWAEPLMGSIAAASPAPLGLLPLRAAGRCQHPRCLGWFGTTALAMGGSNQSLFLITALFSGQGDIPGQGSAAIPLLIVGLLLSYAAAPGWTELVLMSPDRVGGIAAACTAAFRPYSSILSALAGVSYWWGWVPTCGVSALLSATVVHQWCLPGAPISAIACAIVLLFTAINLVGVGHVAALAKPIALTAAALAFVSMIAPVASGRWDWTQFGHLNLTLPFPGWFGAVTSSMAGLYLIGFGAPAFEAAACHVGETVDPARNVPRAMAASGIMAAVYFVFLPVVWFGALGPAALGQNLSNVLGPTFAPVFGGMAKSATLGFMMFNMFHGTLQPLAGASRTLSQLSEDGLLPRFLAWRLGTDAPWTATLLTAGFAILFLLIGDPIWLIAAANFTYLIGICLPSVAVWLLRRDMPEAARLYRAPRGMIGLGLGAAGIWVLSALLGFEQYGLPTVLLGLLMAYSGAALYAWRMLEDQGRLPREAWERPHVWQGLHVKLTGPMLLVLALDAAGYILAVGAIPKSEGAFIVTLEDIFVAVAILTITIGVVLPGMIAHSVNQVSDAARRLAFGTIRDFATAMDALGEGRLDSAHVEIDIVPVKVNSRDELGAMATSFNTLQQSIKQAAIGLDRAREGLSEARAELLSSNAALANTVTEQTRLASELFTAKEKAVYDSLHDPLTGLQNRTFFLRALQAVLTKSGERPKEYAVFFIDLDRFKIVNDSLGHLCGDKLLIQIADRLRVLVRGEGGKDIAGSNDRASDVVARLGGDEFTLLLHDIQQREDVLGVASRIHNVLAPPFIIEGESFETTASIGVAIGNPDYAEPAEILRDADLAMYRAKKLGKTRVEIYDPSMQVLVNTRLHLENDLRRALRDSEFVVHYQPIVSLQCEEIVGFEALVRWNIPGKGLVYPGEFIAVAEETGIIVPLGMWVLREACRQAKAWQRQFSGRGPLTMCVNLSPRQFAQHDLVAAVEGMLAETGMDPALLNLEVTESMTMEDPDRAARILSELKLLNVQLSMDDFGTGYSSLSHLLRFPLDVLKIDRSFVTDMLRSHESRQIIVTIIALAKGMSMRVIAEGIETREQLAELKLLGCEDGQGYLFSKPVEAERVPLLMNRHLLQEGSPTQ
jgi:diguanylate cyclase (GGDEF)-like protein